MTTRSHTDTGTRRVKRLACLSIGVAALLTLAMVRVLQPVTLKAEVLLSTWLLLPYAVLAIPVAIGSRDRTAARANLAAVLLVASVGLMFLSDVIFFHPDAQGPIALLLPPVLQVVALVAGVPLLRWVFRRYGAHIGADAASGLTHTLVTTPAQVSDVTQAHALLHGEERIVFADAGYQGVEKREDNRNGPVQWDQI